MSDVNTNAVSGVALSRAELEEHLAQGVLRFDSCAFDDEDLSRLDLQGVVFERCTFAGATLCWRRRPGIGRCGGCAFRWL
jgi:fluoroquinolone resistance protein